MSTIKTLYSNKRFYLCNMIYHVGTYLEIFTLHFLLPHNSMAKISFTILGSTMYAAAISILRFLNNVNLPKQTATHDLY